MVSKRSPSQSKPNYGADKGDAIIGRAFRLSALVILLVALFAGILVFLNTRQGNGLAPAQDAVVSPPRKLEIATMSAPVVRFTNTAQAAGIDFTHVNGAAGERLLPETMGSGVAFFDFDNDGDQDLLLINSDYWKDQEVPGQPQPRSALFANDGEGRFDEVSATHGLDLRCYGMGVAVGDYDNDGFVDVFITALGENHLFKNSQGSFEEVTAVAGVGGDKKAWSTGSAFFDYDNDGDLDLFVVNYVRWSRELDYEVDFRLTGIGRAYGPPTAFEGTYPYLYRNDGDGTFSDVSAAAGIRVDNPATGQPMAKALAVAPVDIDQDRWMDLLVANDMVQNYYLRNLGDGTFEEIGTLAGIAFDRNGSATGAMGMDVAYFRNDAETGVAVGNFANEMTSLYVTQGAASLLADESIVEGIGQASRQALTFGLFFFDYDLDGRLDLLQANGHLESEINKVQPSQHYAQSPQLFWNCGEDCQSTYIPVESQDAGDLGEPLVGRGAAYADIDGDGDLDILITQNGRRPQLLRNDQTLGNHWLRVKLIGTKSNRDAIGAWIDVTANGVTQKRQVMPTRSYLSQVELPVTFGLGAADSVSALRVRWPDGSAQEVPNAPIDSLLVVRQQP